MIKDRVYPPLSLSLSDHDNFDPSRPYYPSHPSHYPSLDWAGHGHMGVDRYRGSVQSNTISFTLLWHLRSPYLYSSPLISQSLSCTTSPTTAVLRLIGWWSIVQIHKKKPSLSYCSHQMRRCPFLTASWPYRNKEERGGGNTWRNTFGGGPLMGNLNESLHSAYSLVSSLSLSLFITNDLASIRRGWAPSIDRFVLSSIHFPSLLLPPSGPLYYRYSMNGEGREGERGWMGERKTRWSERKGGTKGRREKHYIGIHISFTPPTIFALHGYYKPQCCMDSLIWFKVPFEHKSTERHRNPHQKYRNLPHKLPPQFQAALILLSHRCPQIPIRFSTPTYILSISLLSCIGGKMTNCSRATLDSSLIATISSLGSRLVSGRSASICIQDLHIQSTTW